MGMMGQPSRDIAYSLFIKYGLKTHPSEIQIQEWVNLAEALISKGHSKEQAGHAAAKRIFSDYRTMHYASAADTIEALLTAARRSGNR